MIKTPFGNIIIKASRFNYRDKKDNKLKKTLLNKKISLKKNKTIILSIKIAIWKINE